MRTQICLFLAIAVTAVSTTARGQSETATPVPGTQPAPGAPAPQPYPNPYTYPYANPYAYPYVFAPAGPRVIKDWRPDMPIPPGYHPVQRRSRGEIIAGSIVFGGTYIYSFMLSSLAVEGSSRQDQVLLVPVLGPFFELTRSNDSSFRYLMVIDGLAQGLGLGLFIHGLTSPRTVLMRNDLAMLTVSPMRFGRDGNGLGVLGRF